MWDSRSYGIKESRRARSAGSTEGAKRWKHGNKDLQNYGLMDSNNQYKKKYSKTDTTGKRKNFRKSVVPSIQEPTEEQSTRRFDNPLRPLMSEEEKSKAQILDLSYDFSCRIIRLYKYLNEGKLSKADRDIIDALGRQLVRSATSINANMNEAQHPQSDADFLSKASIALKEARESENWLRLLSDNGYLEPRAAESLLLDCGRINKILITITSKVKKRINGGKD